MPVTLNEGAYDAWLTARPESKGVHALDAGRKLTTNPVENRADKVPKGWPN